MATGFGLDVDRLLRETPLALFDEWRLLYNLEPWGEEKAELLHGIACNALTKKPAINYMPSLQRDYEVKPMPEENVKSVWDAIAAKWGS